MYIRSVKYWYKAQYKNGIPLRMERTQLRVLCSIILVGCTFFAKENDTADLGCCIDMFWRWIDFLMILGKYSHSVEVGARSIETHIYLGRQ